MSKQRTIVTTKRFEIYIVNEVEYKKDLTENEKTELNNSRNEQYQFLRNEMYWQNRAMNDLMSFMWAKRRYRDDIKLLDDSYMSKVEEVGSRVNKLQSELSEFYKDKEKNKVKIEKHLKSIKTSQDRLKKLSESKSKEATEVLSLALGQTMQTIERDYISRSYYPEKIVKADTVDRLVPAVRSDFNNSVVGVLKGEDRIVSYGKDNPLMFRGRNIKFSQSELGYYANLYGITFKVKLPRKRNKGDLVATLDRIISEEYRKCDSQIQYKNNKWYLLMAIEQEVDTSHTKVDGRVLGVDMGIAIPAYVALSDNTEIRQPFGSAQEFFKTNQQFKKRRERLQSQLQLAKGGKGRKDKLSRLDDLKDKKANFAKTYNHQLSKKIVDFAVKHSVSAIHMENLTKDGFDDRLLADWSYYQLREFVTYKAKRCGIAVKLINPAYTSQKCSKCGHTDRENRPKKEKGQSYFKCTKCGNEINADHNAAVNIARSNDIQKEDLTSEFDLGVA